VSPASYRCSFLALAMLTCAAFAGDLPDASDEYHVKALFLYNFAKFVEWPNPLPGDGISIGILGDDPFGDMLTQAIAGKTVNGHGFNVRHVKPEQARQCQIVFVAASERKHLRAVLDSVAGSPILTVGDMHGFAQSGGMIDFEIVDSKVRFEVNIEAAERARLKLSSKLLSLAKIVRESKE